MAAPLKPDPHSGERDLETEDRRISAIRHRNSSILDKTLLDTPVFEAPE
jgi:hypothetical protein